MDKSGRGPLAANTPGVPFSDEEVHSDDKIFREIEDYTVEAKREDRVKSGDPPLYVLSWMSGGLRERVRLVVLGLQPWSSACGLRLPIHL